jgi:hypothetical protein
LLAQFCDDLQMVPGGNGDLGGGGEQILAWGRE